MEAAGSRGGGENQMANTVQLHPSARWTLNGVSASMRAIARTLAAEHTLALTRRGKPPSRGSGWPKCERCTYQRVTRSRKATLRRNT